MRQRWLGGLFFGPLALALVACSGARTGTIQPRADGLDASALPDDVRPAYELFAQRCSKCHSLTRALNSGIEDDGYWKLYVDRMRRQPASGISPEDEAIILQFLHYFAKQQREMRASGRARAATQVEAAL